MKAVVCTKYEPPEVLQLKEVEKTTPKDNEVLVKVYATTVTVGDCLIPKNHPFIMRFYTGLREPRNPIQGHELTGEIESVGKNVELFKEGDEVFASTGSGTYAE
ncbi:alcohol dehydrogenase catalytic domain-containing protein [Chloroflexota bacterium]